MLLGAPCANPLMVSDWTQSWLQPRGIAAHRCRSRNGEIPGCTSPRRLDALVCIWRSARSGSSDSGYALRRVNRSVRRPGGDDQPSPGNRPTTTRVDRTGPVGRVVLSVPVVPTAGPRECGSARSATVGTKTEASRYNQRGRDDREAATAARAFVERRDGKIGSRVVRFSPNGWGALQGAFSRMSVARRTETEVRNVAVARHVPIRNDSPRCRRENQIKRNANGSACVQVHRAAYAVVESEQETYHVLDAVLVRRFCPPAASLRRRSSERISMGVMTINAVCLTYIGDSVHNPAGACSCRPGVAIPGTPG